MKQHTIPKCYLSSFTDPNCPADHEPYIWIFDRKSEKPKKKSPKNILVENDFYTIELKNGDKDYNIETSLSMIESEFISILRNKIVNHLPIDDEEYVKIALFFGALSLRTIAQKEHWEKTFGHLIKVVEQMEKGYGLKPKKSKELKEFVPDSHKQRLAEHLITATNVVLTKKPGFYMSHYETKFITSDNPYMYINPEFDGQVIYPAPPIAKTTTLFIPLTPEIVFFGTGEKNHTDQYYDAKETWVKTLNQRTADHCYKYLYSSKPTLDLIKQEDLDLLDREYSELFGEKDD